MLAGNASVKCVIRGALVSRAVNGRVPLPQSPGLGMELDESKIETRREILV